MSFAFRAAKNLKNPQKAALEPYPHGFSAACYIEFILRTARIYSNATK